MKTPVFIKIQGQLFNLTEIVAAYPSQMNSELTLLIIETRLAQHEFYISDPREIIRQMDELLFAAGHEVFVLRDQAQIEHEKIEHEQLLAKG